MDFQSRAGRLKSRHFLTDINLIPLIDVSLVLVIIFMVITPFLVRSQIEINIPKAASTSQAPENPLELTLTKSGHIFIQAREVKWEDLEVQLASRIHGKSLFIQADKEVPLETVVKIMDIAKRLKVGKLGIAAVPSGS